MSNQDDLPTPPKHPSKELNVDQWRRRRLIKAVLAGAPAVVTLRSGALLAGQSSGGACLTAGSHSLTETLAANSQTRCVNGDPADPGNADPLNPVGTKFGGDAGNGYAALLGTDPRGVIGNINGTYVTVNAPGVTPGRWKMWVESQFCDAIGVPHSTANCDINGDNDIIDACVVYVRVSDNSIGTSTLFGASAANGPPAANYYPMTASCWGSLWSK